MQRLTKVDSSEAWRSLLGKVRESVEATARMPMFCSQAMVILRTHRRTTAVDIA